MDSEAITQNQLLFCTVMTLFRSCGFVANCENGQSLLRLWSMSSKTALLLLKKNFILNWRIIALQYWFHFCHKSGRASLVAQMVKNLPSMQETQVWSLGREDPLEKGMATPPVFLLGWFCRQGILVGYLPWGRKESDTTGRLTLSLSLPDVSLNSP